VVFKPPTTKTTNVSKIYKNPAFCWLFSAGGFQTTGGKNHRRLQDILRLVFTAGGFQTTGGKNHRRLQDIGSFLQSGDITQDLCISEM